MWGTTDRRWGRRALGAVTAVTAVVLTVTGLDDTGTDDVEVRGRAVATTTAIAPAATATTAALAATTSTAPTTTTTTTTVAPTTTAVAPTTNTTTTPSAPATTVPTTADRAASCDPNYSGCVPIASDVDCAGGSGNGPAYVSGPVRVVGVDIYGLDRDRDGVGCE